MRPPGVKTDEREQRGAVGGGEAGGIVLVVLHLLGRLDARLHGGAGAHAGGGVRVHHVHVRGDGLAGVRDDAVGVDTHLGAWVEPGHLHAGGAVGLLLELVDGEADQVVPLVEAGAGLVGERLAAEPVAWLGEADEAGRGGGEAQVGQVAPGAPGEALRVSLVQRAGAPGRGGRELAGGGVARDDAALLNIEVCALDEDQRFADLGSVEVPNGTARAP